MESAKVRWPKSLWAAATPPGPELPELKGTAAADVIVIGGGFTACRRRCTCVKPARTSPSSKPWSPVGAPPGATTDR